MINPSNPEKSRPLWKSRSSRQPTSSRYLFCDKLSSVLQFGGIPAASGSGSPFQKQSEEGSDEDPDFCRDAALHIPSDHFVTLQGNIAKHRKKPREFNSAWARLAFSPSWGWNQEATEGGSFTIPLRNCFEPFAWDLYLKALCSETVLYYTMSTPKCAELG